MHSGLSVKNYLQGLVRGIKIPETALQTICHRAGIAMMDTPSAMLDERQIDLATAYTYLWIATGPTSTSSVSESDGDWSETVGSEQMSTAQIKLYLRMANDIFKKYGLPVTGNPKWGIRTGGLRNIRNYGRGSRL